MLDLDVPVTCIDCDKTYRCTPATDYYGATCNTNGRCWDCAIKALGADPTMEPATPDEAQHGVPGNKLWDLLEKEL